jgi:hypothetical protein
MRFLTVLFFTFTFCIKLWAIDLTAYNLTEKQINLLKQWHQEKRFDEESLHKFAAAFQRHNNKKKPYVPAHTFWELTAVMEWAEGRAFAAFAPKAQFIFDYETYENSCPNLEILNFGTATGTAHFQLDVLTLAIKTFESLSIMYRHHPETFSADYFKLAKSRGFDIYLREAEVQSASL